MLTRLRQSRYYHYLLAFVIAIITGIVIFLPFQIIGRGYFLYYGDFDVQQIPFYKLAHEAVRSGNIFWSPITDLGANFISSYSFYLLGSPFFWLTIPFPNDFVPYLMAPLLILKFGVASVTAFAFIKRFVKDKRYAVIGGLLYAFSGFMIYNIFFNHFNDVVAYFPLMLIALEELVTKNRKGVFALAVFGGAVLNYFMFVGQVFFICIYFVVRTICSSDFEITPKKFLQVAAEAVIGLLMSCILLLPSVFAILENPRLSNTLTGYSTIIYSNVQRYFAILMAFFFPPDIPARPNFFPDGNVKWSSVAAWLPLFSMSGVLAFVAKFRKHWITKMFYICMFAAFVPILNSVFFMFNSSYYARWFYMPILLLALMTVIALESKRVNFKKGIIKNLLISLCFIVPLGFFVIKSDMDVLKRWGIFAWGEKGPGLFIDGILYKIGLPTYLDRFWVYTAIVLYSAMTLYFIVVKLRNNRHFFKILTCFMMLTTVIYSVNHLAYGRSHGYNVDFLVDECIRGEDKIVLEGDEYYRIDTYNHIDNFSMFLNKPTIQAFQSVVPPSIMEFYPTFGVSRDVGSRPESKYYVLRDLLSVKYLIVPVEKKQNFNMKAFEYLETQNNNNIYVNNNYINMGYTFERGIIESEFEKISKDERHLYTTRYLIIPDALENEFSKYLEIDSFEVVNSQFLTSEILHEESVKRDKTSCEYFEFDKTGFTAKTNLEKENFVFFSVPYEKGFTAYVNGEETSIVKVDYGFMAVKCPEGESVIRFDYKTPMLDTGIIISLVGAILLALYIFIPKIFVKMCRFSEKNMVQ